MPAIPWLVLSFLGITGLLGLLAVVSPPRFARIAQSGGQWIDTSKLQQLLDRPIGIDHHVLRYSRLFGAAVIASALWLAYVYATQWW
jgi:hypothetical protein